MVTLVLQAITPLLVTIFGIVSLLVARLLRPPASTGRQAWLLAGVVFVVYGGTNLLQNALGAAAVIRGADDPVYSFYMRVAPVANHSRTALSLGLYAALLVIALRGTGTRARFIVLTLATLATMGAGAAYGWAEGSLSIVRHFSRTAVIDTVGFILLAAVLILMMIRSTVDRYLWFSLAAHGFRSIFGVLYLSAMAYAGLNMAFPIEWQLLLIRIVFAACMVWLALRRLVLARRGDTVEGLLRPERPSVSAGFV